jgi:MFS family permease
LVRHLHRGCEKCGLGPLRTSFACVVTGGAGLALLAVPHLAASLLATAIIGLSYGPLTPASSHVLARYRSGAGMAFLVSVRQTSVPMGGVLAGFVAPRLVLGLGWNAACVSIGGVTAALGATVWIRSPRRAESAVLANVQADS